MEKESKKITIGDQKFSTVRDACTSLHIIENVVRYYIKKTAFQSKRRSNSF